MRSVLGVFRVIAVFFIIVFFLSHMSIVWLFIRGRYERMRWSNSILSRYARAAVWVLGLNVSMHGTENLQGLRNALYVSNHLGYLDVMVISSLLPAAYVTSVEIRQTPGLGQICLMAGCIFVERRNKMNIRNEVSELRRGLNLGLNVVIFPEATSTNGEAVLRFRKPLFFAAIDGGCAVVPVCLNYRRVGGQPLDKVNRDSVFWYGDMDFLPHLWRVVTSGGIEVDVNYMPPIATNVDMDATDLAEQAQREVTQVYHPVT